MTSADISKRVLVAVAVSSVGVALVASAHAEVPATNGDEDRLQVNDQIASFLKHYCIRCHGERKQEGEVAFHQLQLSLETTSESNAWLRIVDKIASNEMPPDDETQPSPDKRKQVVQWIEIELRRAGLSSDESILTHPSRGNWVDHELLFSGNPTDPPATRGRLWRLTNQGYEEFIQGLSKRHYLGLPSHGNRRVRSPWELSPHEGFRDYANQHRIGEPEIEHHLRNAKRVASGMMLKLNKTSGIQEFKDLVRAEGSDKPITPDQITAAAAAAVDGILGRQPTERELKRYTGFLQSNLEKLGAKGAIEQLLVAVLFHPEVIYRIELPIERQPRAQMAPRDLARSIAYALTDREPDEELRQAAEAGKLSSHDDIRAQVVRILGDHEIDKPRILRFFQEYFDYTKARDVFKDETTRKQAGLRGGWQPDIFVSDTDQTILWILRQDHDVLRQLLTTSTTFTSTGDSREAQRVKKNADKPFDSAAQTALDIYEIDIERAEWSDDQPFEMPSSKRRGILTHPSWLIAHSTNFDNHAIQRGHWIRERLLGGRIPDVPVTVDAQLPDEPHETLRERMRVTREEYCWKCHQQMDPLGLPFEQYDHFGRFRTEETVLDRGATEKNVDKNGKSRGVIYTAVSVDTSGDLQRSGDSEMDGQVSDPIQLMEKLATSQRTEQVFVRHAFRYFIGRNETLADGPVLVAAHVAYAEHEGSMNALIASLLTSDAFLYRTVEHEKEDRNQPSKGEDQ